MTAARDNPTLGLVVVNRQAFRQSESATSCHRQVTNMAEGSAKRRDPPPIRIGRLRTKSDARCATRRIANAVIAGLLDVKRGNCVLYAIATAVRTMEVEVAVRRPEQPHTTEAVTAESVLDAWNATRKSPTPALPSPEAEPEAIVSADVAVPAAVVIAALAARDEATGDPFKPSPPAKRDEAIDVVEASPGVWSQPPRLCGLAPALPPGAKPADADAMEKALAVLR
jgi:hypothetical protein